MRAVFCVLSTALTLGACQKNEAPVQVRLAAQTNQGEAIAAATVAINGRTLGETDNSGLLTAQINLPTGEKATVEVHKDSEAYYFSPFTSNFNVFTTKALSTQNTTPQVETIKAILYLVPKPAPAPQESEVEDVQTSLLAANSPSQSTSILAAESTAKSSTTRAPRSHPVSASDVDNGTDASAPAGSEPEILGQNPVPSPQVLARSDFAAPPPLNGSEDDGPPKPENLSAQPNPAPPSSLDHTAESIRTATPAEVKPGVVFTVHVFTGEIPLADATVQYGEEQRSDLRFGCRTNARGRCVIRFSVPPEGLITFVAAHHGYKTASATTQVRGHDKLRITLDPGLTLDIFALTKSYNRDAGLKGVDVYIGGKRLGETDRYGRYSHNFVGKPDDMLKVSLKAKGHLPEVFDTDFVLAAASGPLMLTKYFMPIAPPVVHMAILQPAPAGTITPQALADLSGELSELIRGAARRHLFGTTAFRELPLALYERDMHRSGKSRSEIIKSGWQNTELKAEADAIVLPTIILGAKPALELSVIDSQGRILAAGKEDLQSLSDRVGVEHAMANLATKIIRAFPYEGAILAKTTNDVTFNIGSSSSRGIRAGDILDVYGTLSGKQGLSQTFGRVATLTVRQLLATSSVATINRIEPRAFVDLGDLVVLRPRATKEASPTQLQVHTESEAGTGAAIAQANVYIDDVWVGATDESGMVTFAAPTGGTLKIIKQGYEILNKYVSFTAQNQVSLAMRREAAFLRLDSRPSGLKVRLDGLVVGKTPLTTGVPVATGFVKLEIEPPTGYKPYASVLELEQGTLQLTGEAAVTLEKDYLTPARRLIKAGKIDSALAALASIPQDHSDYLPGRHEAGELYLTVLGEPAKAAESFGQVTANPAVKQFSDKRFIGSHVNEGVALFMTAERLSADGHMEEARAHYQKSLEILANVSAHLRFVPAAEQAAAVHSVDYHSALAKLRLANLTQDMRLYAESVRAWRTYLDGDARTLPVDAGSKGFIDNANVYYKQAQAALGAAKSGKKL